MNYVYNIPKPETEIRSWQH